MSVLIAVPAKDVQPGDEMDLSTHKIEAVVAGRNGQVYLVCKSTGGANIALERDPDEIVSVRR